MTKYDGFGAPISNPVTTPEAVHHDAAAQRAGETAYEALIERSDETGECTCATCVVREILDAAYDHLVKCAATDVDGQEHVYVSTACQHGKHEECRIICKFCMARCRCTDH